MCVEGDRARRPGGVAVPGQRPVAAPARCPVPYQPRQGPRRAQHRLSPDHGPGRAEAAGVVPDDVGVRLPYRDQRTRGAELGGGDLAQRGGDPAAGFDRSDGQFVRAVGGEGDPGVGEVPARPGRGDHRYGAAVPDQPSRGRLRPVRSARTVPPARLC